MLSIIFIAIFFIFLFSLIFLLWKIYGIFKSLLKELTTPRLTIFTRLDNNNKLKLYIENIGVQSIQNLKIKLLDDFIYKNSQNESINLKDNTLFGNEISVFNPKDIITIDIGDIFYVISNTSNNTLLTFQVEFTFNKTKIKNLYKVDLQQYFNNTKINDDFISNLYKITKSLSGLTQLLKELKNPNNTIHLN